MGLVKQRFEISYIDVGGELVVVWISVLMMCTCITIIVVVTSPSIQC